MRTCRIVARQPSGTFASRRSTLSRGTPRQPQAWHPVIRLDHSIEQHGVVGMRLLADHFQAKVI
jgi:hypothetical protein